MEQEQNLNLNQLQDDYLYMILANLQVEEIVKFMEVNKRFNNFVKKQEFWKIYFMYSKNLYYKNMNNLSSLDVINYLISMKYLHNNFKREIVLEGVLSTSQDNSQSIIETLNDKENLFWSSLGTENVNDRDEELIFCVKDGLAFIDEFSIKFFFCDYLETNLFQSERVLFQAGMSFDNLTYSEEFVCNVQYTQGEKQYIVSRQLKTPQIARIIKITFKGRIGLQETDNKYYFAVSRVKVLGVPIHNIESKIQIKEIDDYIDQKIKNEDINLNNQNDLNENINAKKNVYSQKIHNLTQTTVNMMQKSLTNKENVFNKNDFELQEAQQFIQSQNLELFNTLPEMRVNIHVYEYLMNHPELMSSYLKNCVKNTTQLSELESITVLMQKLNFRLLSKYLICFLNLFEQFDKKDSQQERDDISKLFGQFIYFTFAYKQLPYEIDLSTIYYFSFSQQFNNKLILNLTDYLDIKQEVLELITNKFMIKDQFLVSIPKYQLFNHILQKIIPEFYFMALNTLIAQPERNITYKQNLFNTFTKPAPEEKCNQLLTEPLTEAIIKSSKKYQLLMKSYSISSFQEMLIKAQEMYQQANQFLESQDLNQFETNPQLCQNVFVFEILINSSDLMQQYFEKYIIKKGQLNDIESISVFIQKIDYQSIALFIDLLLDLLQNQTQSSNEKQNFRMILNKFSQIIFKNIIRLKELPYEKNMKNLEFTKSCLFFYYIIKPLQNFIKITDQDVENISLIIKSKIYGYEEKQKSEVSYQQYKSFIEQKLFPISFTEIIEYLLQNYSTQDKNIQQNVK